MSDTTIKHIKVLGKSVKHTLVEHLESAEGRGSDWMTTDLEEWEYRCKRFTSLARLKHFIKTGSAGPSSRQVAQGLKGLTTFLQVPLLDEILAGRGVFLYELEDILASLKADLKKGRLFRTDETQT